MSLHYLTDQDLQDYLPSDLTNTVLDTAAKRTAKLRTPARAWIDSVYPTYGPFPNVSDAIDWAVNQTDHDAGDSTVTIDGGSTDPAAGEIFRVVTDYRWHDTSEVFYGDVDDSALYRVVSYAANVLTYEPTAALAWGDDSPIYIGTPRLIRTAAAYYALHLAYQMLRQNPEDKQAAAYKGQAMTILGIDPKTPGLGTVRPESTSEMPQGVVPIERV